MLFTRCFCLFTNRHTITGPCHALEDAPGLLLRKLNRTQRTRSTFQYSLQSNIYQSQVILADSSFPKLLLSMDELVQTWRNPKTQANEKHILSLPSKLCQSQVILSLFCIDGLAQGYGNFTASAMTLITRFMGPTWGPSGADRTQVGPMLAPPCYQQGLPQFCAMPSLVSNQIYIRAEISKGPSLCPHVLCHMTHNSRALT